MIWMSPLDPSFDAEFRRAVLGNHAPENVVLLEIDPQQQKTLPDFLLTRESPRHQDRLHHKSREARQPALS